MRGSEIRNPRACLPRRFAGNVVPSYDLTKKNATQYGRDNRVDICCGFSHVDDRLFAWAEIHAL
jgi:hypothetical protein